MTATTPSCWTAEQVASLQLTADLTAPIISEGDFSPVSSEYCVWDAWPVLMRDGSAPKVKLWMALASRWFDNPDDRHGDARIYLMEQTPGGWRVSGPAMPEGFSPGSREWSGSAVLEDDNQTLTLFFTAAGHRDEQPLSYDQRLFEAQADLQQQDSGWTLNNWRNLNECIVRNPALYADPLAAGGQIGTIKAFRDPGYFRDPKTGEDWLFFTASLATSASAFNGTIGAAKASLAALSGWDILPPVISADRLNNELERPHVVVQNGLYYLFWSTQTHVFDPEGPTGPTGLYGMVSDRLDGGWEPLNGSGLVIANPPEAPRQAYSWLVMPDLSVTSFVDDWGRGPDATDAKRFGGCFAPFLRLELNGATTRLVD
jgi:levansucrase